MPASAQSPHPEHVHLNGQMGHHQVHPKYLTNHRLCRYREFAPKHIRAIHARHRHARWKSPQARPNPDHKNPRSHSHGACLQLYSPRESRGDLFCANHRQSFGHAHSSLRDHRPKTPPNPIRQSLGGFAWPFRDKYPLWQQARNHPCQSPKMDVHPCVLRRNGGRASAPRSPPRWHRVNGSNG